MSDAKALIKKHEGISLIPYRCPAGFRSIGYGYNFDANPLPDDIREYLNRNGKITIEMSERLLDSMVEVAVSDCKSLYPTFDGFSKNRRNALIDWLYNIGKGTAKKFVTTNRMINDGDWDAAADNLALSKWYKQVGRRGKEICALLREG